MSPKVASPYAAPVTVAALLERERRRDGARPFLTWYDDAAGARVELSVATTANWAAKIANYLADDGIGPGDVVGVDGATHWITVVVMLGAWTAGAHVDMAAPVALDVPYEPLGVSLSQLVAAQPDQLVAPVVVSAEPALTVEGRTWSHRGLAEAAHRAAAHHGLGPTSRILSTLDLDTADGMDVGLLMPLAAAGAVVLVVNANVDVLADTVSRERITQTAGVDVPNIPRLDRTIRDGS